MLMCSERIASRVSRITTVGTESSLELVDSMDRWSHEEDGSQSDRGDFTHRLIVQPKSLIRLNTLRLLAKY
jgi:hypothetical protein